MDVHQYGDALVLIKRINDDILEKIEYLGGSFEPTDRPTDRVQTHVPPQVCVCIYYMFPPPLTTESYFR
jgi:hypothetical protein